MKQSAGEAVGFLIKKFWGESDMWESQAKSCALLSIVGPGEIQETEKARAESYYCMAQTWGKAAQAAECLLQSIMQEETE